MQVRSNILETIGNTPLIAMRRLFPNSRIKLLGKLESGNPGGSIKDRAALRIIEHAIESGRIKAGDTVVESSSGNMAIGLAQICLFHRLHLIVVVDPCINPSTVKILRTYGAKIEMVTEMDISGNYLNTRINRVKELLKLLPGSFWPNQYDNPKNAEAHFHTMQEIMSHLSYPPNYLFVTASTCGTLMGCAHYIRKYRLSTKIIAVDAVGSVLFGSPAGKRFIPGHGAGRPSPILDTKVVHDVVHVTDLECVAGCRSLLEREAVFCGGSSGAVISGLRQYMPKLPSGAVCIVILPDRGERYLDTIYNPEWVSEHLSSVPSVALSA